MAGSPRVMAAMYGPTALTATTSKRSSYDVDKDSSSRYMMKTREEEDLLTSPLRHYHHYFDPAASSPVPGYGVQSTTTFLHNTTASSFSSPAAQRSRSGRVSGAPVNNSSSHRPSTTRSMVSSRDIVLGTLWSIAERFVFRIRGLGRGSADREVLLPLQMLLLAVRFLKLSVPWDDVLRIVRRHAATVSSADGVHLDTNLHDAIRVSEPVFAVILDEIVLVHLALCDRSGTTRHYETIAAFWNAVLESTHDLVEFEVFLDSCFQPVEMNGLSFCVASVYTASVLDALGVYSDRLHELQLELSRLGLLNESFRTRGLLLFVAAQHSAAASTVADDHTRASPCSSSPLLQRWGSETNCVCMAESLELQLKSLLPSNEWFAALRGGNIHGADSNTIDWWFTVLCETVAFSAAVIFAWERGNNIKRVESTRFAAEQLRGVLLDLLGELLSPLILPQPLWQVHLCRGVTAVLAAREDQRHRLRQNMEMNLRQLYLYVCSFGDVTGTTLVTKVKLLRLMAEGGVTRPRDVKEISQLFDMYSSLSDEGNGNSSVTDDKTPKRSNNKSSALKQLHRERFERKEEDDREVNFPTFVRILDGVSKLQEGSFYNPRDQSSLGDDVVFSNFASGLMQCRAGQDALKCVSSEVVTMRTAEDVTRFILKSDSTSGEGAATMSPLQGTCLSIFKKLCLSGKEDRKGYREGKPATGARQQPKPLLLTVGGNHATDGMSELLDCEALVRALCDSRVIPCMCSRADASKALRNVLMDKPNPRRTDGSSCMDAVEFQWVLAACACSQRNQALSQGESFIVVVKCLASLLLDVSSAGKRD